MYIHCTYCNYHYSNAILFDVIVFYSNACLEFSVRNEYLHRTTTASIYANLMLPVVVDDGVVWRCT